MNFQIFGKKIGNTQVQLCQKIKGNDVFQDAAKKCRQNLSFKRSVSMRILRYHKKFELRSAFFREILKFRHNFSFTFGRILKIAYLGVELC